MAIRSKRIRAHSEEGESVFVSMTDLTVSFLFIILILLAFFAKKVEMEETTLATYLERIATERVELLDKLKDELSRNLPGIQVTVDVKHGVIRFRAEELFASGQWEIRPGSLAYKMSRAVGDALADTLPCYTLAPPADAQVADCPPDVVAAIETIQIEGHTDDVPISGRRRTQTGLLDNRDLSARRGAETLRAVTDRYRRDLMSYRNRKGQPVLSFAGYGEMRPIDLRDSEEARAFNRRIDIRFILETPQNVSEVEEIRQQLIRNRQRLLSLQDGEAL